MIGDRKIVWFDQYCPSCVHRNEPETSCDCSACLNEPGAVDSHKPVKYDKDPKVKGPEYSLLRKLQNFLYEMNYTSMDYAYAKKYFKENTPDAKQFGCSCVRKGFLYGRNYDWYYDNYPSFVIHVPSIDGRHASLAVCQGFKDLTNRFVETKAYSDLYKILPFIALDGINDAGVVCNVNVAPAGDWGATTGTTPAVSKKEELSVMMLNRYILDNFATAEDAVSFIHDHCSVYSYEGLEFHYMVADSTSTYIIEFLNNETRVLNVADRPYMTNFYIKNSVLDISTGLVDRLSLTPHGSGVERYELIVGNYDNLNSIDEMASFMHYKLKYTNSYNNDISPFWYTELVGDYETFGDLTVLSPESDFQGIKAYTLDLYEKRSRDTAETWQTVHTIVYDMNEKAMYIIPQEEERSMQKIKMKCEN